jgi:hypothetical protein
MPTRADSSSTVSSSGSGIVGMAGMAEIIVARP